MNSAKAETNWLDVLLGLIWPTFALIAMVMFSQPILGMLNRVSKNLGTAEAIEVGPLKVKFTTDHIVNIKEPGREAADAITKMKSKDIEFLITHGEGSGISVCRDGGHINVPSSSRFSNTLSYELFNRLGLIEFRPDTRNKFDWCRADFTNFAYLTDLGNEVREYLLSVLTSGISITSK